MFALLNKRGVIDSKVFYTWGIEVLEEKYDPGFGKKIQWDVDLMSGYDYEFLDNVAIDKGSHHFKGIDNPGIIESISNYKPDAILIYGWPLKSHYLAMKHFKGRIPVYFRGDSILKGSDNLLRKCLKKIYISWVYRLLDKAFYTGIKNKEYFLHYGLNENQLVYAPHAVNNSFFSENLNSNKSRVYVWRNSLLIPDDAVVFLYAGKLDANKNTHFILSTFMELKNASSHFIIAGEGEEKKRLEEDFGKYKNIHFLSFQNQSAMPFLYGMADVFVLPSQNETWGLSVNEAMVCGCAVLVSSTIGAAPDLVQEGLNGYIFELNNKTDLLNKLHLMQHKSIVKDMGFNASKIINNWSHEIVCKSIESEIDLK